MRLALVLLVVTPAIAFADPSWSDTPALLDAAIAPHANELRACVKKVPRDIGFYATRSRNGDTEVSMPLYGVGHRGPTPEESCLVKAIAKLRLPPLPTDIERIALRYTLVAAGDPPAKLEKRYDDWRDPATTIRTAIGEREREGLGVCARKSRTARVNLDLSKGKTRIWLPAWQFHSDKGDGSTPPSEAAVKACMAKVIRSWSAPVLPMAMGEIQLAFPVRFPEGPAP